VSAGATENSAVCPGRSTVGTTSAESAAATPRPGEAVGEAAAGALDSISEGVKAPRASKPSFEGSAATTLRPGEVVGEAAAEAFDSISEGVEAPQTSMPSFFAAGSGFDAGFKHRLAEEVAEAVSGTEHA
jgi:hypothetical protein